MYLFGNFLWYLPKHGVLQSSPLQVRLAYGPLRGLYLYPLSPHCNSGSYSPTPFYGRTSCQIFFPPGPGQLSSSFFLALVFPPPFHFHLYCLFFVPFTFIYYFSISSPFLLFPFSLFPAISYRSFSALLYYLDTSPTLPLDLGLVPRDYIPSLNFSVTELFVVLIFFLP